jgi:hypothetical protein
MEYYFTLPTKLLFLIKKNKTININFIIVKILNYTKKIYKNRGKNVLQIFEEKK